LHGFLKDKTGASLAIFIAGHERGCESLERFVHAHNTV